MAYVFLAELGEPNTMNGTGTGDSYKLASQDSTISTTSDANYKHTRPRTTRMIRTWTYAWNCVKPDVFAKLMSFWNQVGTFQQFEWTDPMDNETHIVRFAEPFEWQYNDPNGWQGTLKFEEV